MTTLQTIAKKAGVSAMTVSNVLNRRNKETWPSAKARAEKIRRIADDLGYRPNMAARAIQTSRFNAIGLLASINPELSVYAPYIHGLTEGCRRKDLHLSIGEVVDEKLSDERFVPRIMREWCVDGLLIAYMFGFPQLLAELIEQYQIPSIWLNAKRGHDCVHTDDMAGFRMATEHLIRAGHRRIAYVGGLPGLHYSGKDRLAGYEAVMHEAGLAPIRLHATPPAPVPLTRIFDDTRQILQGPDRPTAFLCHEHDQAVTAYHASISLGLSVPGDVSVIATGHRKCISLGRNVSTLGLPVHEAGRQAVEMLAKKIRSPGKPLPSVALPFEFLDPTASVAPPNE